MKRVAVAAVLFAAMPVLADGIGFRAFLNGYEEVPSVSTRAHGVFQAQTNDARTGFEYTLAYEGLQGTVTQAHIHFASRHVNGAIVVWLCGTTSNPGPTGTPTCPATGSVRGTVTPAHVLASPTTQQLNAGEIEELIQAMRAGATYVNVHTSISPGGEIRGQVFRYR